MNRLLTRLTPTEQRLKEATMELEQRKNNGDLRSYNVSDWLSIALKQALAWAVFAVTLAAVGGAVFCFASSVVR